MTASPREVRELDIPETDDLALYEMARLWLNDEGERYVSLNYGTVAYGRELSFWGSMAADLLIHATRAYRLEGGDASNGDVMAMIEEGLRSRLAEEAEFTGAFSSRQLSS